MKELLLRRKLKFVQYLFATFLFVLEHFVQMALFALILGAIEKADSQYYKWIVLLTIIYIIYSPLNFLVSRMLRIRYMRDTILDVRRQAFHKIINMPFKQYSQKSKEIYISNLVNDVNQFERKFFLGLLNFLIDMGMISISILLLIIMDYKLTLGMLLFSLFLFALASLFLKKTTSLEQEVSKTNEHFTIEISNTFNGLEILKLNSIEDKFLKKSYSMINRLERRKYLANVFTELQRNVIRILSFVASVAVMIYLGFQLQGDLGLAKAALLFQLCSSVSEYLIEAFPMWNQTKASVSIYEKIAMSEVSTVSSGKGLKDFTFQEQIALSDVDFSYENNEIIKDATFTIEKGKKYLIKGISGAGKSTLMKLIAMVYDDYKGKITVDGVDYRDISEKSFHEKVAFIYQDVFLFEDTIRNNITLYKDVSQEQIDYTVRACGLASIIADKKEGIDELLSENGKNLSGGQRQRISIARAIAKNAEILFVDEGTSSLNEEIGREIEKLFLELDNTVIAISHRYYEGISENYDFVLEIKNGKVNSYPARSYFEEVITC